MNAWFPIRSDKFQYMDWSEGPYKGFKGPLISEGKAASVSGGFGNMLFQGKLRPLFSFWLNDYAILESFLARTAFNFRTMEFRMLLKSSIEHRSRPYSWSRFKAFEMNLSHSLAMDSDVRFERGCHYRSFDIHFEPEMFERLALTMPELVCPFLNDYYAGRELHLFKVDLPPNVAIVELMYAMIGHVTEDGLSPFLLDQMGEALLGQIFLWKAEIEQRRGLTDRQLEIARNLTAVKNMLTVEDASFKGIKQLAQIAKMSPTMFKTEFKKLTGFAPFRYWQQGKIQQAVLRLLTTRDSVKDIALSVGFSDGQSFDKAFKKMFEESPSDYRKRIGKFDIGLL